MKKNHSANVILIELVIVILFFMLASTTVVEVFGAAKLKSNRAHAYTEALAEAQNLAEQLYTEQDGETCLSHAGFVKTGDHWEVAREGYSLKVAVETENKKSGILVHQNVEALFGAESLFSLPCDRFVQGADKQ